MILKWILRNYGERFSIFVLFTASKMAGYCEHGNDHSCSIKESEFI
jgi:hypothetical protein